MTQARVAQKTIQQKNKDPSFELHACRNLHEKERVSLYGKSSTGIDLNHNSSSCQGAVSVRMTDLQE
jgi:hypothetical protein